MSDVIADLTARVKKDLEGGMDPGLDPAATANPMSAQLRELAQMLSSAADQVDAGAPPEQVLDAVDQVDSVIDGLLGYDEDPVMMSSQAMTPEQFAGYVDGQLAQVKKEQGAARRRRAAALRKSVRVAKESFTDEVNANVPIFVDPMKIQPTQRTVPLMAALMPAPRGTSATDPSPGPRVAPIPTGQSTSLPLVARFADGGAVMRQLGQSAEVVKSLIPAAAPAAAAPVVAPAAAAPAIATPQAAAAGKPANLRTVRHQRAQEGAK